MKKSRVRLKFILIGEGNEQIGLDIVYYLVTVQEHQCLLTK